ncbi:hypothetical protein BA766_03235 [Stenotrophomonas maltophilia]|uniref:hypothetical protein n=1 Tax=Stenotrophomonas maltophilia TaxID=40324 RepID=UPI000810778B|nr:hypothetical protein [Stenotrophomonas maltophilia]OCK49017.1 hypothetical protein BA766_03235 [Stenotrophomonas maltophilia]
MRAVSPWNTFLLALTLALATTACRDSTAPSEAKDAARTAKATAISATEIANSSMAVSGNAPAAYQKYYTARNVQPLIADLEFLSRSGDANASFVLSRIYDDCAVIPDWGSLAGLDISQEKKIAVERSTTWFKTRCEGMPKDVVSDIRNVKRYKALAVKQGNLAAQIEQAAPGLHLPDQHLSVNDHKTFVEAVLMQDDGEAYMALAATMGETASRRIEEMKPYKVGNPVEEAAWMLAGCRKGVPCDANSPIVQRMCRAGGCGYNSLEELYSNEVLAPEQMQQARARADEIIALSRKMK